MPTGYTAKLVQEGQTFQGFVLRCARGFGALVHMREDPLDAPFPDRIEPSDFYAKELLKEQQELDRLQWMSGQERIRFGEEKKAKCIAMLQELIDDETRENERLAAMEKQVRAWTPPSADHVPLKKFMLEQIRISKSGSGYFKNELDDARAKLPIQFYYEQVTELTKHIERHKQDDQKERERAAANTEWIRQLKESLR